MTKIGHVIASASHRAGGLFFSVRSLARATAAMNRDVSVFSLDDDFSDRDLAAWAPLEPVVSSVFGPRSIGYSPDLTDVLRRSDCDILHTQGIWQGPSMAVHAWHRRTSRPYIVSPRGMLDRWALSHSSWKKWIAARVYENRHLRDAKCLHALCQSEADAFRNYGLSNPICIVPNGVSLPERIEVEQGSREVKTLLFLGRLHEKKGLANAIMAWSKLSPNLAWGSWRFVIAGWDQGGHKQELMKLCLDLGVSFREMSTGQYVSGADVGKDVHVLFLGSAFGEQKDRLLRLSDAFVLPSFSEGLPMAVLEAWAYGLVVVMTEHCNLPEGFHVRAAIRVDANVDSLLSGFCDLTRISDRDRVEMGSRGRRLVEDRFAWDRVAKSMVEVYDWMLGCCEVPSSVRFSD